MIRASQLQDSKQQLMQLTITRKKQAEKQHELIELSSRTHLCRINHNNHDTTYLITSLCSAYGIPYTHQFGSICAHVCLHYPPNPLQHPPKDWRIANHIVNKFNLIFLDSKYIHKVQRNSCFRSFEEIVLYGMKAISYALQQKFLQPLNKSKNYYERLKGITAKLLKSLLLEFIPTEYSGVILGIYVEDRPQKSEKDWLQTNKERFVDLFPYQDIFQLLHSLSYHLISNKVPVNVEHFLSLLESPVMGVVEWPMVIGSRDHFDLPPLQQQQ